MARDDSTAPLSSSDDLERLFAGGREQPSGPIDQALAHTESLLFGREATPVTIGRYVLLGSLGRGGFGVVHCCYDPQLDRKVAIKLMRAASPEADAALLHEARAASRLSHRNVVTVHDVGRYHAQTPTAANGVTAIPTEGLFMVMELAEGPDLGAWLRERRRTTWEIVAMLVQAGEGLAAAHEAGIVHLDFKPRNVIVDAAGVPKVADFGLARTIHATPRGAIAGTPAYMAPEQHRAAEPAPGPAADQYAFCVALHEALVGRLPFVADDLDALLQLKLGGPPRTGVSHVPERVMRLVRRGLAPAPEDRHRSMRELVDALARAGRRRAPWIVGGIAVVGVAAAVLVRAEAPAPCAAVEAELAPTWPAMRASVEGALAGVAVPYAGVVAQTTVRELDAWATAWLDVRRTQCNAAIERSSATVAPHASMCLEAAHARFAALVERLAGGDEKTVIDAFNLVDRLPNVIACSGDQGGELGPAVRDEAVAIEHELARALTMGAAAGLAIADSALVRADATAVPLLGARARLTRAQLLEEVDRTDDAIASYHDALVEAESSGDDRLAVEALVMLAFARGVLRHDFDDAHTALDLAAAKVERSALDWLAQARVIRIRGQVLHAARRWPEALVELERAHALYVEHLGSDHPNAARLESSLAATKFSMGDIAGAEAHTRHALEVVSRRLGEDHPSLLFTRGDLAVFAKMRGDTDEAVAQLEVLVPKIDLVIGDGDHRKSVAFLQLGGAQLAAGRAAAAVATLRRAVELRERMLPESDLDMRAARAVLLEALVGAGELDEARRELADLRRIHAEHGNSDPDHPKVLAEIADMLATATR